MKIMQDKDTVTILVPWTDIVLFVSGCATWTFIMYVIVEWSRR